MHLNLQITKKVGFLRQTDIQVLKNKIDTVYFNFKKIGSVHP